uniref:THUMP domain-containing protein n=2 Tax=Timema TaxID=61471 RepID=A0A7R9G390_TIMSH|nr:unnamed protein product [Timema shepardi]
MKLRSVDKVHLLSKGFQDLKFTGVMDNDIMTIKLLSTCVNWQKTISVWDRVNSFIGIKYPSMAEYIVAKEIETKIKALSESFRDSGLSSQILDDLANKACAMDLNYDNVQLEMKKLQQYNLSLLQPECPNSSTINKTQKKLELKEKNALEKIMYNKLDKRNKEEKVLKYRVTCLRKGDHCFGSQDAAHHFGGELQDQYNWVVDLSHYDLNILLCIMRDELYCGVTLTKESLHHRNITHFGPTTLRATVCYSMLCLGCPNLGDIIVDPLGGGGSLSIEPLLLNTGLTAKWCTPVPEQPGGGWVEPQQKPGQVQTRDRRLVKAKPNRLGTGHGHLLPVWWAGCAMVGDEDLSPCQLP